MRGSSSARPRSRDAFAGLLAGGLGLLPVLFGPVQGGYSPGTWLGAAAALAILVVVLVYGRSFDYPGLSRRLPPAPLLAVAIFTVFCLWNLVSVAWAVDRAAALTEASRTVFLLLLFTLALAVVRTPRSRTVFLTALVLGTAGLGLLVTVRLGTMARPADLFDDFKMMYPVGYANATGALFALPALLGLFLASEPGGPVWRRSVLFAGTVLLLEMTTLSQSRGAFWALFGAAAIYLAVTPRRVRALLWGGSVVAVFAVGFSALNVLHLDALRQDMDAFAVHTPPAVRALAVSLIVGLAVGAMLAVLDRSIRLGRRVSLAVKAGTFVLVATVLVLTFIRYPALQHPVSTADRVWTQFTEKSSAQENATTSLYFLTFHGSGRAIIWQVAWDAYREHPAKGVGADNFVVEWNRNRPTPFAVRQPHNLYLRLLSELGIPGLLLFVLPVGLVVGSAWIGVWRRRHAPGAIRDRMAFAAVVGGCAYFLAHDGVEWLWNFPALAGSFFLLLGTMAALVPRAEPEGPLPAAVTPDTSRPETEARRWRLPGAPAVLLALAAVTLALCLPQFLSERLVGQSRVAVAQGRPAAARTSAAWAARLNPLDGRPYGLEARAWSAEGDAGRSEAAFRRAAEKNPADWLLYLQWAEARAARKEDARAPLAAARRLNPLEPSLNAEATADAM